MIHPLRTLVRFGLLVSVLHVVLLAEESAELFDIRDLDVAPKLKPNQPVPFYPYAMSRAGLVGRVTTEFVIDQKGLVRDARVVSSNNPWFERPALDAVVKWKFSPGLKGGRVVNVLARQLIEFNLDGMRADDLWQIRKAPNHNKLPPELQWDEAPRVHASTYPVYPFEFLKAKTKGKVTVGCVLGANGRITQAKVTETTAPEFAQAVMAMLPTWEFQPAKKAGQPCQAVFKMEYEFNPEGGDVPVADSARGILKELQRETPKIYGADALDRPLRPIYRKAPLHPLVLPPDCPDGKGEAVIEFYIDLKGDAQLPRIVSCSAPEFGYAAVQAVARWRFDPPQKDGKPILTRVRAPIEFAAFGTKLPKPVRTAAAKGKVYPENELGPGDVKPKILKNKAPVYPKDLLRQGISGSVKVAFVVDAAGEVRDAQILELTHRDFGVPAIQSIMECKFKPSMVDGQPVAVSCEQLVEFDVKQR